LCSPSTRRTSAILVGLTAFQRHRKQQIVVGHATVAVDVERRKVLDQLDAAVAEYTQVELRIHPLELATGFPLMGAPDEGQSVSNLPRIRAKLLSDFA
jgi:hypothetical protein